MTTRIILAAVLGAIAMFIWMFVAHMVLPLGEAGISELPNETTVLDALQTNISDKPGIYMFPGLGVKPDATRQEMKEAMERMPEQLSPTSGCRKFLARLKPMSISLRTCSRI